MTQPKATAQDRSRDAAGQTPALGDPPTSIDPDWRERIELAKRVREETRKARGDKPSTFDLQGPRIRIRPRRIASQEGTNALSEKEIELVHGSANVFRDFGEPHADLKRAKAVLAARIIAVLDDRGLPVREAASLTGFAAADFSRIRNADLGHFTLDCLMKMLAALDAGARVTVKVDVSRSAPGAASSPG